MKKTILSILTITTLGFGAVAQLPSNSFFEYEFTGGSLNNTSASGAPNFTGSITSIDDRNANANDAADITGVLSGAAVGASNVSEMTLTFWMKHAPLTSNQRIIQIYGIGGKGFKLEMNGSQLFCYATIGGNNASYITTSHSSVVVIDNSAWHHIAIRTALTNAATIEYDIFVDNVPVPNLSNQTLDIENYQNGLSITNFLSSANLVVSPTNNYSGDIDDIYFYKSALTDAEITQIYNYSPPPCTVNVPDANFKAYLVGNGAINTNGDTEIQCSEATAFTGIINCSSLSISDLTGIEAFTDLSQLDCANNQLTSLDVSSNTTLGYLHCDNNQLTSLDVSSNTTLVDLRCYINQLTSLDVSQNTNLTSLYCGDNQLSSLDVSLNTSLTRFYCGDSQLSSLNLANGNNSNFIGFYTVNNPNLTCITVDNVAYSTTNWTNIDAIASFSLNCAPPCTVNIPDANFKAYLVGNTAINTNGDTEIQCSEASAFTGIINCSNLSIADVTGIEMFPNLTYLLCPDNQLTSIDITNNTALIGLNCSTNPLAGLDVSSNASLVDLYCNTSTLTTLDVTNNPSLTHLECKTNSLTSLDISSNPNLNVLKCTSNSLTSLDVSNNTAMTRLESNFNMIQNLDISNNVALTIFTCNSNSLTSLNAANGNNSSLFFIASSNPNLTCITVDNVAYSTTNWTNVDAQTSFSLNCNPPCTVAIPDANFKAYLVGNAAINTNGNTEIECSEATAFTGIINCANQSISDLTGIEAFSNITSLYCNHNSLSTINLTQNTSLVLLQCNNNSINSLDVTQNIALNELICHSNLLINLDLTQNTLLTNINCSINLINNLILDQNLVLVNLYCDNNTITNLDLSQNTALSFLKCHTNSLTTLNVSNGNNSNIPTGNFYTYNNPNLTCITVDNVAYSSANWTSIDAQTSFSTNCAIAPCTVAIPDVNFKAYLVGNLAINTNGNAEIECSEASAFTGIINCNSQSIADLTGIEAFPLLTTLYCYANSLTALDVSNNTNLTTLYCNANNLTVLDLSNNTALNKIYCDNNSLAALDVSNNTALTSLRSNNNSFTTLNVANGNNTNFIFFDATVNPSLTCITVDNVAYSTTNWTSIDAASSFNTNCSGTVGIEELSNESLSVYPNPVKNQLFIELNEQITEMVILDYSGRIVKTINGNSTTVNVSDLTKGIYILKVATENGVLTNRFIKQ